MSGLIQEIDIKKNSQRDKNIKEWNRINNIWLDIKIQVYIAQIQKVH